MPLPVLPVAGWAHQEGFRALAPCVARGRGVPVRRSAPQREVVLGDGLTLSSAIGTYRVRVDGPAACIEAYDAGGNQGESSARLLFDFVTGKGEIVAVPFRGKPTARAVTCSLGAPTTEP